MRIAVISDIHGNLEAFRQVLDDIDNSGIDRIISLGDNIGYGPDPEEVIRIIRERGISSIMGNHELACLDPIYLRKINPTAQRSMEITKRLLSESSLAFCASLPAFLVREGIRFVHGSPPESISEYLFNPGVRRLQEMFTSYPEALCFYGHTHLLALFSMKDGKGDGRSLGRGKVFLEPGNRYLINAGSVGQPRDGNNKAKYIIWGHGEHSVEARLVSYNIRITAERIIRLGFPEFNAKRLY